LIGNFADFFKQVRVGFRAFLISKAAASERDLTDFRIKPAYPTVRASPLLTRTKTTLPRPAMLRPGLADVLNLFPAPFQRISARGFGIVFLVLIGLFALSCGSANLLSMMFLSVFILTSM
jgi:hypothetical protein